jgi:hypothetical protein
MAQKKAFVRYAQNKAVPGSLIVRTKAPSVGTWKEVSYDLCCGGGSCNYPSVNIVFTTGELDFNLPGGCSYFLDFSCNGLSRVTVSANMPVSPGPPRTIVDFFNAIVNTYAWMGTWTLNEDDSISLEMNGILAAGICLDGIITITPFATCPA